MSSEACPENPDDESKFWFYSYLFLFLGILPTLLFLPWKNNCLIGVGVLVFFTIICLYVVLIFKLHIQGALTKHTERSKLLKISYYLIVVYIFMAYCFGVIYYGFYQLDKEAFEIKNATDYPFVDFLYYSVVTVTTLGYGDISPAKVYRKLVSIMQVLIGFVYIIFIVSMVLSAVSQREQRGV
jgi:hypothetical protein